MIFRLKNSLTIVMLLTFMTSSCELFKDTFIPECNIQDQRPILKIVSIQSATNCINPDGEFKAAAERGLPPYRFVLDNGETNYEGVFKKLAPGEYKLQVFDAKNCDTFLKVIVEGSIGLFQATSKNTTNNTCFNNNGTITVISSNGIKPLRYQLDDRPFQTDSVFYQLDEGNYKVTVKDANNCTYQFYSTIEHGITGVSYRNDVQPVLARNCNMSGCHNGDAGSTINFTQFSIVRYYGSILIRYASMNHRQPPISQKEIDYIRCWVEDGKPEN